jgi:hypothetical protein
MGERRELTAEERRNLAGYLPFSNEATIEYTPVFFLRRQERWDVKKEQSVTITEDGQDMPYLVPDGYRPTFTLRCFTKAEYDKAQALLQDARLDKDNARAVERLPKTKELLRAVVMGWVDLWDLGKMEMLPFKADPAGGCDKVLFDKVPDWIFTDLQSYVYRLSGITPGERLSLK